MRVPSKHKEWSIQLETTSRVEKRVACSEAGKIPYYFLLEVRKDYQLQAVWQDKVKTFSIEFSNNHPLVSYEFFRKLLR